MHARTGIAKTKILNRQIARSETFVIRGARIFVGDGKVIENGSGLVRGGKIAEVYEGAGPDPKTLKAETVEAAGKTILPGLIDVHVHLGGPGGIYSESKYDPDKSMLRNLAAYLYSGVTTVRSVGDITDNILKVRSTVSSGEVLGSDLLTCGPLFTAAGGHGTEYFKNLPAGARANLEKQFTRIPGSSDEARQQVDELKKQGVDCIKAILDAGAGGRVFNRLDTGVFDAIAQQAHADSLPLAVHTGDARDVADAVKAQANSIAQQAHADSLPRQHGLEGLHRETDRNARTRRKKIAQIRKAPRRSRRQTRSRQGKSRRARLRNVAQNSARSRKARPQTRRRKPAGARGNSAGKRLRVFLPRV